jgi:microcystin-dependent protein
MSSRIRPYTFAAILATSMAAWAPQKAEAQTAYLGQIYTFPYNFCPAGFLATNGALLPINQNTALFSLLGTMYGGDGVQTFALPNLPPSSLANGSTLLHCIATSGIFPAHN